ncbi:MAG: hypothetical protein AB7F59_07145 [Bdellovibrionales bacterium]
MNWKKLFKIGLGVVFGVVTLSVISLIYLLTQLPSKTQIQQTVQAASQPDPSPKVAKATATSQSEVSAQADTYVTGKSGEKTALPEADKKEAEAFFFRLTKEDPRDIQVCRNLFRAKDFEPLAASETAVNDFLKSAESENPYLRSMRPAARYLLQKTKMKEMMEELEKKENGEESLAQKSLFYYKAVQAVRDVQNNQKKIELMADRSMHLYVLSQLAHKNSEIAREDQVMQFCDSIEEKLSRDDLQDIEGEREDLVQLIESLGLTPQELNFDPKKRANLNIQLNPKDLQLGLGFEEPQKTVTQ